MNKVFWDQTKAKIQGLLSWENCINIVSFIGLLVITLYQGYFCIAHFLEYPTYTTFKLVNQNEVDFPSMTFCPDLKDVFKVDVLEVNHGTL